MIFFCPFTVPPSIEGPERELVVATISNPVTLTCDATGIPPPTIAWMKNRKPIGNAAVRWLRLSFALNALDSSTSTLSDHAHSRAWIRKPHVRIHKLTK